MHTSKLYYGAAYYDEYMPYDRLEKDMEMMEKAGMNLIRIAESTWSTWEPQEGHFDFTHLHRMLAAAARHNISVIVGTPTYAIPAWLAKKADDILALTHNGPELYGHRQNMDITNPIYRTHAQILIEHLMLEVKDYPHVIGFQIDNETKSYDTCGPRVQEMFVHYLKENWPDIHAFNHEFGLDYWSNRIDSWEDFPDIRGTINGSLAAEFAKFQRGLVTEFFNWQAQIINKYRRPEQFITQNFDFEWIDTSYGLQPDVNQFDAAKCMDVAGCDIYHPTEDDLTGCEITVCGNIAKALKRDNYLVLETEAQGNPGWLPYPGQLRLQAYSHIACGANCVEYWHWHSIHNAIESYWKGVLSHDLCENDTYRDCAVIGNEWKQIGNQLVNLKKTNAIAVVADNASLTGMRLFPTATTGNLSYNAVLRMVCDTLFYMNLEYDIIPADETLLSDYTLVIVPALYSAKESFLNGLDSYVANGGNLICTYKTAFSNEYLKIYADQQPHILSKALGIHYDQFTLPKNVFVSYGDKTSKASEWMEMIICDTAKVVANYEHSVWNRFAAVTKNNYQKGHALYLGTMIDCDTLAEIFKYFLNDIGFKEENKLPVCASYPVSIKQGINDNHDHVVFYLNYSPDPQTITNIAGNAQILLTGQTLANNQTYELEPWGVAIFIYK